MITQKIPSITVRKIEGKWQARISDQTKAEVKEYARFGKVEADTPEAAYWKLKYHIESVNRILEHGESEHSINDRADKQMDILRLSSECRYWKARAISGMSTTVLLGIGIIISNFL